MYALNDRSGVSSMAPSTRELAALIEELIKEPLQKANIVPRLISALSSESRQVLPVIQGLKLFFLGCFERGDLWSTALPAPASESAGAVYAPWLQRQYAVCTATLLATLASAKDSKSQLAALSALMEFVRGEQAGCFNNLLFARVVTTAVCSRGVSSEVVGALVTKYGHYADVRYHVLCTLRKICERRAARAAAQGAAAADSDADSSADDLEDDEPGRDGKEEGGSSRVAGGDVSAHDLARNVYDVLVQLPKVEEGEESGAAVASWCGAAEDGTVVAAADTEGSRQRKKLKLRHHAEAAGADGQAAGAAPQPGQQQRHAKWASPRLHRRAYSDAWLSFLRLSLPDDIYRKVLAKLHDAVIPALFNPLLLSDFLTRSLDKGGLIGMLALNGIFVLVTRHGLEYPRFYERLYGLLTPEAFQSKHRTRFFQLADIFLASGLVPAYTGAAFAKRFARLALRSSPAAALIAVAFVHNIVRRHPACMQLLHRAPAGGLTAVAAGQVRPPEDSAQPAAAAAGSVWRGEDVYLEAEADPANSRALESSLWELTALRQHACPMVSTYCAILEKDLTNRCKTSEVDISELVGASYSSLFAREVGRRLKQAPAAFYAQPPTALFEATAAEDFPGWAL